MGLAQDMNYDEFLKGLHPDHKELFIEFRECVKDVKNFKSISLFAHFFTCARFVDAFSAIFFWTLVGPVYKRGVHVMDN